MKLHELILPGALLASCSGPTAAFDCRTASDCDAGFCVSGECSPTLTTRSAHTDGGGIAYAADGAFVADLATRSLDDATHYVAPCADAVPASSANVAVNEILVNVPAGPRGDANGDGVRDAYEDEFVELVNVSEDPIDMRGVSIYSSGKLKFVFEPWCLLPGEPVVIFGGGSVGVSVTSKAAISDTRFAFGNDGGLVTVSALQGEIARVEYGRSSEASLTRAPQLLGREWVPHTSLSALPFSPGSCPDGTAIASGCPAPEESGQPPDIDSGTDAEQ